MPSTFPESFGMVAAEAAACGALPLSANHSGMAEVTATLRPALPERPAAADVVRRGPGGRQGDRLEARGPGSSWTPASATRRAPRWPREAARRYSWESVAEGVIEGCVRPAPTDSVPAREPHPQHGPAARGACALAIALSLGACGRNDHLETGKAKFVEKCGSCHTLARAGTQGTTGPEPRHRLPGRAPGRLRPRHGRGDRAQPDPAPADRQRDARRARAGRGRERRGRLRGLRRRPARARTRARCLGRARAGQDRRADLHRRGLRRLPHLRAGRRRPARSARTWTS